MDPAKLELKESSVFQNKWLIAITHNKLLHLSGHLKNIFQEYDSVGLFVEYVQYLTRKTGSHLRPQKLHMSCLSMCWISPDFLIAAQHSCSPLREQKTAREERIWKWSIKKELTGEKKSRESNRQGQGPKNKKIMTASQGRNMSTDFFFKCTQQKRWYMEPFH